jgi:hypothetical protein
LNADRAPQLKAISVMRGGLSLLRHKRNMNIVTVAPETRIDRLIFHPAATLDHVMHIGIFTCRHCGAALQFNTSDFERHFLSKHSNLEPKLRREFDEVRPLNAETWECFLDFNCISCGAPARITYNPIEYHMGSFYYEVASVLETEEWNVRVTPGSSA